MKTAATDLCEAIRKARKYGDVICGIIEHNGIEIDDLAERFGISIISTLRQYTPVIERDAAKWLLVEALYTNLAYGGDIMPLEQAEQSVEQFFAQFGDDDLQFFDGTGRVGIPHADDPNTGWTFDQGVFVIGKRLAGVLFVVDED